MNRAIIKLIIFLFIISTPSLIKSQRVDIESLKKTALSHMSVGRYGEAIDQLNKYIAANPQEAEGYNLRALCYEKRTQYQNAVLDFRRAISLEKNPNKKAEYENNLRRVQEVWYALLNKKIEGHLREIAINPNNPFNYLEIGKSYRWMEIWDKAEQWYDEYLKRDDNASPDEIIRYTEILAKTGSLVKGERILKKYVERYPDDWRLWSRYGYFTMWLGKYQIAKKAFETALSFKPFFLEAQDGLDIVNRQAYITLQTPRAFEREYPIDRYYRILKGNPADTETRLKLIDELIAADRIEEAYQQIQVVGLTTKADDPRFQEKWAYVKDFREKTYRTRLDESKAKLRMDPSDINALKLIAEYYEYLQEYDSAMVLLNNFYETYPDEKDPQLKYRYARIAAWNREFDKSINVTDNLLLEYPNNLDYQLFRAQVSVWIKRDIELARKYLENVISERPDNLEANITIGSLKLLEGDFDAAQQYANKAKEIDPTNEEVIIFQSNIDWQRRRYEEEKIYAILERGREKALAGDCTGALLYYEDYLSQTEPNVLILKEYGDVLFCGKDYKKALSTYDEVLAQGYYFDAALQHAKVYYAISDSINALREFKELVKEDSSNFDAQLYLADSYIKVGELDSARIIYNMLQNEWQLDSTQVEMIKVRKGWLAKTAGFPFYFALPPFASFYSDNLSFRLTQLGTRIEIGHTSFLSVGVTYSRGWLKANESQLDPNVLSTMNFTGSKRYTTFKGQIILRLSKYLNVGAGLGRTDLPGSDSRDEQEAFVYFEKKDTVGISLIYQKSDASLIMYSSYLIDIRNYANLYRIQGYYRHRNILTFNGSFQFLKVSDGNAGNDLVLRIGRYFYRDFIVGYEYYYTNYKFGSQYYYSPDNFESHCLWIDNELERSANVLISLGGKVGLIPKNNLIILEGHVDFSFQLFASFFVNGRIGVGSTYREDANYKYFSGQITAYWTIF